MRRNLIMENSLLICAWGKHLIIIYTNIIEYQYVGDANAPLLRVIDSKQPLKNGSMCELEPTHRIVFFQICTIKNYFQIRFNQFAQSYVPKQVN